jgi:POT family proton-dependent oligopeptide transporter
MRHWANRAKTNGPANLLARMSLGCVVAALSMVVMIAAAALNARTGHPVGAEWVIAYFVLLTIGELLVIPVGLTLVGALSPVQVAAMAMGGWYIAKFLGSLLAGAMGAYWGVIPATIFFALGASSVMLAAIILYILSRLKPVIIG